MQNLSSVHQPNWHVFATREAFVKRLNRRIKTIINYWQQDSFRKVNWKIDNSTASRNSSTNEPKIVTSKPNGIVEKRIRRYQLWKWDAEELKSTVQPKEREITSGNRRA